VTGLAGCSALPFSDEESDDSEDVTLPPDAVGSITWPESPFPVGIPDSLTEAHDERARELLAAVPETPSIPNRAIAEELRSERERVAERLDNDVEEPWPTDKLSEWRGRRETAATVWGSYRAATGENDSEPVTDRRRAVRDDLSSFVADHEYRAPSPPEAVLAHASIESLVTDCRRRVRPEPAYPADPVANPLRAGDAVGRIEHARATLDDARGLWEAYVSERPEATPQWAALIEASNELRRSVVRTRSTIRDVLEVDEPPFDADLEGTAGRTQFRTARRRVEAATSDHEEHLRQGDYATAVIEAGRALAAIEALRATVEGIRNGAYQDDVTVESVTQTADRAREATAAIKEGGDEKLAALLARPVFSMFESAPNLIEEGYTDPVRLQGELALTELYARAVPAATEFLVDRLR
jgi:hypothetical protein